MSGFTVAEYAKMIGDHEERIRYHARSRRIMIARACEFYSQREVARAIGLSSGTVWRICEEVARGKLDNGRSGPKVDM